MITIDGDVVTVTESGTAPRQFDIWSSEAFEVLSNVWLRAGWGAKYVYGFTWLGRPIIQLPEDLLRLQELVYSIKPDVIIETGVAHGGSLVFCAGLCKLLGNGRVVGIDVEIRPHNRAAIESHPLAALIALIEGDSIDPAVVDVVQSHVKLNDTVMVLLDSCHSKQHVLRELQLYSPLVSVGSYIIAMDGIMQDLVGAPRTQSDWNWNNPQAAAREFVATHSDFAIVEPSFLFNEGSVRQRITYWPSGFIKRLR